MSEHRIEFGELSEDGGYVVTRTLSQAAIGRCPFVIFAPEHYRADESCRCDDPEHTEMREWGYVWSDEDGRWIAGDDEEVT